MHAGMPHHSWLKEALIYSRGCTWLILFLGQCFLKKIDAQAGCPPG